MEGIKESKEMIEFVADLIMAVSKARSDGQISIGDAGILLALIPSGASALAGSSLILKEASDYSPEEMRALSSVFQTKLDLPDDKVEQYVEYALTIGLYLAKLVGGLRK